VAGYVGVTRTVVEGERRRGGLAQASGCPSTSGKVPSPDVIAAFSIDGTGKIATYSITTPNDGPMAGIPGLIKYCVFTSPDPNSLSRPYGVASPFLRASRSRPRSPPRSSRTPSTPRPRESRQARFAG
jgi:hypothetical protein